MGAPVTPICAPFYIGSPEENPLFFYGEDFLRFFPEPFPGVITPATLATVTLATATVIIITAAIITTTISNTPIKVKAFPFGETF